MHHEEIIKQIKDSGYVVTLTIGAPQDQVDGTAQQPPPVQQQPQLPQDENLPLGLTPQQMQYHDQMQVQQQQHPLQPPMHENSPVNGNLDPSPYQPQQQQQFTPAAKPFSGPQNQEAPNAYLSIDLHRGNRGFGFSIRGGQVGIGDIFFVPVGFPSVTISLYGNSSCSLYVGDSVRLYTL